MSCFGRTERGVVATRSGRCVAPRNNSCDNGHPRPRIVCICTGDRLSKRTTHILIGTQTKPPHRGALPVRHDRISSDWSEDLSLSHDAKATPAAPGRFCAATAAASPQSRVPVARVDRRQSHAESSWLVTARLHIDDWVIRTPGALRTRYARSDCGLPEAHGKGASGASTDQLCSRWLGFRFLHSEEHRQPCNQEYHD